MDYRVEHIRKGFIIQNDGDDHNDNSDPYDDDPVDCFDSLIHCLLFLYYVLLFPQQSMYVGMNQAQPAFGNCQIIQNLFLLVLPVCKM